MTNNSKWRPNTDSRQVLIPLRSSLKCINQYLFKSFLFPDYLIREGISVQVQKVIQGLDDADDSQATSSTHCKLEPTGMFYQAIPKPKTKKQKHLHDSYLPFRPNKLEN